MNVVGGEVGDNQRMAKRLIEIHSTFRTIPFQAPFRNKKTVAPLFSFHINANTFCLMSNGN